MAVVTTRKHVSTDPIKFRNIWNGSKNIEEVAKKTGKTVKGCMAAAWFLRKKHIMCKKFPRGRKITK